MSDATYAYGPKGRKAMEGVSAVSPIVSEINFYGQNGHNRHCAFTFWVGNSAEVCMTTEEMSFSLLNEANLPLSGFSSHGILAPHTRPASRANKHHEPPAIIGEIICGRSRCGGGGLAASFTDDLPRFRLLFSSTSPSLRLTLWPNSSSHRQSR